MPKRLTSVHGVPAITPRADRDVQGPASMTTATFTAQDARAYAEQHWLGFHMHHEGPWTVESIRFVTEGALDAEGHLGHGVANPNRLLCVVEVRAPCTVFGPPLPSGRANAHHYDGFYARFDAKTGNFLATQSLTLPGAPEHAPVVSGQPAITPYLYPDDPSKPAFTEEDARTYIEQQPLGDRLVPIDSWTVGSVTFVDYPDGPICEVEIIGPFRHEPRPEGWNADLIYDSVVRVFDARTGNALHWKMHQR